MPEMSAVDLVSVHGGLSQPVDRVVPLNERAVFLAEAEPLAKIVVTAADLSTVYRIADGALSPLEGPMKEEEYRQVLDDSVILRSGSRYAWTIPLSLPVSDAEAVSIDRGDSVAVSNESGEVVAIVDDSEVFEWDKVGYVRSIYGTERFDHPGGRMVETDPRTRLLGGSLRVLPQSVNPEYG
ncbi:MAG: sulfate adenylyltransferase, partial [Myxococcota bacterium]